MRVGVMAGWGRGFAGFTGSKTHAGFNKKMLKKNIIGNTKAQLQV
jgi:hypothetical protein